MTPERTARVPDVRWRIAGLIAIGVLVNYFDRISLSVAGPQFERSFHLTPVELGLLFSAFFWSYALLQIPGGLVLDRFGVTRVGRWSAFLWGAAQLLTACAGGFAGIFAARLLLGIAEAPSFPANSKATGYWFPRAERALSTALYDFGAKFSNVIGVPLVALAVVRLGWRWGFGLVAVLSFVYFVVFYRVYRDPSQHPKVTYEELAYIAAGGAEPEGQPSGSVAGMLGYLLGTRKVWGLVIGFGAYGYSFNLFLTWLPDYLVRTMHRSILTSAGFAAIPWACGSAADLVVGGWLIDFLVGRGRDETRVRKTVLVISMCTGLAVLGATATDRPGVALVWISVALTGLSAAAPIAWSLTSLIAPKGGVGAVGGIMNFSNNMMGVVAPIVTGFIVGRTHSFVDAFLVAGLVLFAGVAAFVFLLGRIESLPGPPARHIRTSASRT
ncbi:MAG TPA: MFS transporter [Steroidobacteraceae bacterium]|nr:MFS transporter [Steroidobacteraceae bacterium]